MKKAMALLLVGIMTISIVACGGNTTKKVETTTTTEVATEVTGGGSGLDGIDLTSEEVQVITEERASMETLAEAKNEWLQGLNIFAGTDFEKLTYEDFVAHIGCDASEFLGGSDMQRVFIWHPAENEKAGFQITFYNYGNGWTFNSLGTSNIN